MEGDIHECIENTLVLLDTSIKYEIEVERNYDEHIPKIHCYYGQLSQVFMNVLSNAIDAIKEKKDQGKIVVTTKLTEDGEGIKIWVKDNGVGIAKETSSKVFDPFFTSKSVGKGTGLGLSISENIIQKHEGYLSFESVYGEGTTFEIFLPV